MSQKLEKHLHSKLSNRKEKETYRSLPSKEGLIDFSSNDYLGFATDNLLQVKGNPGAGASRLISGNHLVHDETEKLIAQYHKAETALLFNSGYDANVGLLGCISSTGDTVLFDELSHASVREGIKLGRGKAIPFKHNDLKDLRNKMTLATGNILVATEGIFSMDGDEAPLEEMADLCQEFDAALIVDEAHSSGVIGDKGEGLVSSLGLESKVFARVHTYGKAFGCHGAAILGSPVLRNYLINYARSFIFTTGIPPHSALAIQMAYKELAKTQRIKQLHENISLFKNTLSENRSKAFLPSASPIQSWIIQGSKNVRIASKIIRENGYDVKPIVAPTVPEGTERIRICIHAFNTKEELLGLANCINRI